jgi:hypothetical protein
MEDLLMKIDFNYSTKESKEKVYPWLGIYTGPNTTIVLFTSPGKGIRLNDTVCYYEKWAEVYYKPYEGKITLEND